MLNNNNKTEALSLANNYCNYTATKAINVFNKTATIPRMMADHLHFNSYR